MKTFQEFILEASCNKTPKGMDCPSHGSAECPKVKSHKTVEAIAAKHRLDVSFIANQLKMGIPIEHEHTKNKTLATDIALQHLEEIPDYYTRLKKMEASAKKEHKKFKDVKETVTIEDANGNTFLEIIDLIKPERMKGVSEERKSGDYSLHDWFSKSKSSDGKPGWVQLGGKYAGKPCARQPGQTTKPKCGSSKMSANMSDDEEDAAARRKRKEDPNSDRSGQAKNVKTEEFVNEDACKEKVKSRYRIWPSAYASGAVVKCRKVGAANWGNKTKNENVTIEDANGKLYAEVIDLIKPDPMVSPKSTFMANNELDEATRLQSETGNIIAVILSWRGKTYSIRMFFPQVGMPSKKDVTTEIQKVYPGALVLQYNVSTLQPGMPLIKVVNSKSKNYLLNNGTIGEETIEEVAAWQRKEGKSQSGGLNEKGRKSYERENPGSNLQRPQPEGGSRRDSFCARMKGMKRKLTSAKTANDPDSRINKSLRAWNC
jgi:hypothetical protein